MLSFIENWLNYRPEPGVWWVLAIIDILFLSVIIYLMYRILVKTRATSLLMVIVALGGVYFVATLLKLSTVLWLIKELSIVLVIVISIVYQPELRKIFTRLVRGGFFKRTNSSFAGHIDGILDACQLLSQNRRGALFVFERKVSLKEIVDSGTRLNGEISTNLLVTIFQFDTALHDGAVVIQNGRVSAAGCFLPLSEQAQIKKTFGTRHRAALGASESSDAIVLVVSEETGSLSLAYESQLYYDLSLDEVKRTLLEYLEEKSLEDIETLDGEEGNFGS